MFNSVAKLVYEVFFQQWNLNLQVVRDVFITALDDVYAEILGTRFEVNNCRINLLIRSAH